MWENKNFYEGDDDDLVMVQVCDFLNENNIKDFKIVQMEKDYLEIIYWVAN